MLETTFKSDLQTAGINVIAERLSSTGKYHEVIITDSLEARKAFMRTVKTVIAKNDTEEKYDTKKKKTFHCKRHMVKIGDELKEFFGTRTVLIPFAIPV